MKSIEFLNYKQYPQDQYLMGIATIRVPVAIGPDRVEKLVLRYKHVKLKTGGEFFTTGSHSFTENGVKGYADTAAFDSRATSDELQDFLRDKVREALSSRSVFNTPLAAPSVAYPVNASSSGSATKGAASQDDLPF